MKIFEHCPFCKSLLQSRDNGDISINKKCLVCNKIDATFKALRFREVDYNGNDVYCVEVTISDKLIVGWWLEADKMYIYNPHPPNELVEYLYLPFIEPDFSDYEKLCKKIKLYALFS